MIYWAPLLHFYQPSTQLDWVLDKICNESYRPLIEIFRDNPLAKVTVNINGVLTELLWDHGKRDIIKGFADLAKNGQLEFTGSGKYHPILPLIPQREMNRQIAQNYQTNNRRLGKVYSPKGFFPPEMGYSRDIIKPVVETGHQWLILSGVACPVAWPTDVIHQVDTNGKKIAVFFRDDILSNNIAFQGIDASGFLAHLTQQKGDHEDIYVITAMDAETFGHHIKDWEKLFLVEVYQALESEEPLGKGIRQLQLLAEEHREILSLREKEEVRNIEVVTISQLLDIFPRAPSIEPKPSSWSTTGEDITAANPYPLWSDPDNQIHQLQWEHMNICIEMVEKATEGADNETSMYYAIIARGLLDRALHSDQFWWASKRPMWDINLINRGLMQQTEVLLNAYKAIKTSGTSDEGKTEYGYREIAARDLANRVRDQLFRE
jgi:alpha-amylase/alpha-mannosidase (GH57 family)